MRVDIETAGRTIQLILAPVVMVTACGILLTGMLAHYSSITDRIRALAAERLSLVLMTPAEGDQTLARERLTEIDHQAPMLIHRHLLVRHGILLGYTSVVTLVVSMFVIGAAALADSDVLGTVALFVFFAGTAALMVGAGFIAVEVRMSHTSVAYEAMRVFGLDASWASTPTGTSDQERQ